MPFDPPGHGLTLEITAYKSETRWIPVLLIASLVLLGGMIVWSVMQLRRQLARRQQAEAALREESAFRRAMEDSLLTGMRARDMDGRLTYVNSAFCSMTGYRADELIGLEPPLPYWLPDHTERRQELLDRLEDTGSTPEGIELRFRRKNGEVLDVLLFEAPLIDARGRQTGWMGSVLDVTEQKRARELARQQDERLQATSRLVTMGEMASTLAHELNQPLAAIASYSSSGCINRLESDTLDRAELLDIQQRIARQARRAGEIIRRVHDFVRRSEPQRAPLDLNTVIRDAVGLIEADARKRQMRIVTELAPGLPRARRRGDDRADHRQPRAQRHGRHARHPAPSPRSTHPHPAGRPPRLRARSGPRRRYPAGDRRTPVPALLHHQARRHGHGPEHLPLDRRVAPRPPDFRTRPRGRYHLHPFATRGIRMNPACAHIIDDDEAIRDALQWLFKTRGVACRTWDGGEPFLDAWQAEWRGCIVLDIRMHGMSGLECFDTLLARGQELPVIFITGHGDVPMAVAALKKGAFHFIEKPFNDHDLVDLVEKALALDAERQRAAASRETIEARLATLTQREREVMELILEGKYNKVIADELSISMRTVEAHRSRIFDKMAVRSAVELAQMLTTLRS